MSFFAEECPIVLTPKAYQHMLQILKEKNIDLQTYGLRVGVKGGGCGGAAPLLGFDTAQETDHQYVYADIRILVEKKHLMYVLGLELDYEETDQMSGFVFQQRSEP